MRPRLTDIASYVPWLALFLLAGGAVLFFIGGRFDMATNLLLGSGGLLLLGYALLQPEVIRTFLVGPGPDGYAARRTTANLLLIAFFAGVALLLYWLAVQNPDWRLDLTETRDFTAPPETVALLEELAEAGEPVHVIAFFGADAALARADAEQYLRALAAAEESLSYQFVDPAANPLLAQQYELNFDGTLVFIRNRGTPDEQFTRAATVSDRAVYAALLGLANPIQKKLYMMTGHGEPAIDDFGPQGLGTMVGLLEDQGFTIEPLNLLTTGTVPADASLVALIGPQTALDPVEVEALAAHLEGGGAAFIARDVVAVEQLVIPENDPLDDYLDEAWGVRVREDVIVDQDLAQAGQRFGIEFLAAAFGESPIITEDLQQFGVRFSIARSVDVDVNRDEIIVANLVLTGPEAWGETGLERMAAEGFAQPDPDEAQGTLTVGASAQSAELPEQPGTGARLVIFGDADFLNNSNLIWGGNSLLFSNALNWLAADTLTIDLTPRETVERQILIPEGQLRLLRLISIWLPPLVMAAIGALVWRARRSSGEDRPLH